MSTAPLRGIAPYRDGERAALTGRDAEADELVRAITSESFRAGLLYGEPGIGKTSILAAAVIPTLRDAGVTVVLADDPLAPGESLVRALGADGPRLTPGEAPSAYLARVAAGLGPNQLALFVIDDVDRAIEDGGEAVLAELNELYARVVGRSAGRARFLFACASDRLHLLGALERRTGSLFPPTARFELTRMTAATATDALARVLADAGIAVEPGLTAAVAAALAGPRGVSPAELQVVACALRDLRIATAADWRRLGGRGPLLRQWLVSCARATGDERLGLRTLAELSADDVTAAALAERVAAPAQTLERAVGELVARGAVRVDGDRLALAHSLLAEPVRDLTALERAVARRSHELLGKKADSGGRLTLREWWTIEREGLAASTAGERAVLARSRAHFRRIAIAAAAAPVVLLVILWWAQRGHAYLDVRSGPGGDRVVVKAGRPGLRGFDWLPSSPGFGDAISDPGLSRAMVDPASWSKVRDRDLVAGLGDWDRLLDRVMTPRLGALVAYATTGDPTRLAAVARTITDDDQLAELLLAVAPIARGAPAEVAVVDAALTRPTPAVRQAALAVAGAAARRVDGAYKDTLVAALTTADPEQRRIAVVALRALPPERARTVYSAALAGDPEPAIRRELLAEIAGGPTEDVEPSLTDAAAILADPDAGAALRERAKAQFVRAMRGERAQAAEAALAIAPVWTDEHAPDDARLWAIALVRDEFDVGTGGAPTLSRPAKQALASPKEVVRAAIVPLYARVAPAEAAPEVERLSSDRLSRAMRVAVTLAWGELARAHIAAAGPALEKFIKDDAVEVRAAAAEASGFLGRPAQEALVRLVKIERLEVATGACRGLANSAAVGASMNVAINGIAQLWKRKGAARRAAARVFADMARRNPGPIMNYLVASARTPDDPSLHPIGTAGLCAAAAAGNAEARRQLIKVADDPSPEVRRMVIACATDGAQGASGVAAALRLVRDPEPTIRVEAARVLAQAATRSKASATLADALVALIADPSRDVRAIAIRTVGGLAEPPKTAAAAMQKAFATADEAEKLTLIRTGRTIAAAELVELAIADAAPAVRIEAVDAALATSARVAPTVAAALADSDPQVRRAVLDRLGRAQDQLDAAALERALALAVRDPDPGLRQIALTTLARVGPKDAVTARLGNAMASRAEHERAQAAAAALGLVERDAPLAVKLLTPLLDDPSHDVRVALLASLGAGYAAVNSPEQLAQLLGRAEGHAMRRLVAAAAFVMLARTDAGKGAATTALGKLADRGRPMVRRTARLALGLIEADADGIALLEQLVP